MSNVTEPSTSQDLSQHVETIDGQKVGYARVSAKDQNLARQEQLLTEAGVKRIFTDKASGSSRDRPGLEEALRYLRDGDQLIIVSMDRLARSLGDLHTLVTDLTAEGVSVQFLKEGQTYSKNSTPVAKLMLGLLGSVAEFERAIIRERQAEGIARAKKRGVYKGRSKTLSPEQIATIAQQVEAGVPKAKIARQLGISRPTLYRYIKEEIGPTS